MTSGELPPMMELTDEDVENIRRADSSIVDDMTTFLAYLQSDNVLIDSETIAETNRQTITPHLLTKGETRLAFLLGLGVSADLITTTEGKAFPRRAEARTWLTTSRHEQVKILAEAWRRSIAYRDLWHVPGLHPEDSGWAYDPVVGRGAFMGFLAEFAPEQNWLSVDDFIETVKDVEPDFQRPGGDFESWYIRNDAGEYLNGFESWDAVEGALLEFYLMGPMHWLGLVDVAEDAVRMTAYGRAFMNLAPWPQGAEDNEIVAIKPDGTLLASRACIPF